MRAAGSTGLDLSMKEGLAVVNKPRGTEINAPLVSVRWIKDADVWRLCPVVCVALTMGFA